MKDPTARDSLDGFLHDIDVRIARQERHTHHSVGEVIPTGAMVVSADHNNATRFGTDAGIYTREIVAKADVPTAADFGGLLLPGSVWVDVSGGPPTTTCVWADDFERADGVLGAEWADAPDPFYGNPHPVSIVSGAAVCAEDTTASPGNEWGYARRVEAVPPGGQFVQMTVDATGYGFQQFYDLNVRGNNTDARHIYARVEALADSWYFSIETITAEGLRDVRYAEIEAVPGVTYPVALRLESLEDGTTTLYVNGATTLSAVVPFFEGGIVGIGCSWTAAPQPRILSATGGCLE